MRRPLLHRDPRGLCGNGAAEDAPLFEYTAIRCEKGGSSMSVAVRLLEYLDEVLKQPERAALDVQALPQEFREFGEKLASFAGYVQESRALAEAISQGDLDVSLPSPANEIAAPLKSLHAALKHLTWQSQQVAKGDYRQRVDFMGEFSTAFNDMVVQLAEQRATLLSELENRRRENRSLIQNKNMYEQLVGQLEQWVVMADVNTGEWLFVSNEPYYLRSDLGAAERFRLWVSGQIRQGLSTDMGTAELELESGGVARYYSVSLHPIYWYQRSTLAFILTDVSRERETLRTLQNVANRDPLTQLYNRRYGMQRLSEWLDQRKRFVLGFVDIDNLKGVNDQFGHMEGDRYITLVSGILSEFSSDALICRIGGDEFILLAQDWDRDEACARLEQLKKRMADYSSSTHAPYDHSISYGIILVEEGNTLQAGDLLSAADERMYMYKRVYKRGRRIQREIDEHLTDQCPCALPLGDRELVGSL